MKKIIFESSNTTDTPADIEDKILKAAESLKIQREKAPLKEPALQEEKVRTDNIISKVFSHMIQEIDKELSR